MDSSHSADSDFVDCPPPVMVPSVKRAMSPDIEARERRPVITVVTVLYESRDDGLRLVGGLASSPRVRDGLVELVVVDNASSDVRPGDFEAFGPGVRYVRSPENVGFAAGVNIGLRHARGAWLLLLNPDCLVDAEFLNSTLGRIAECETRPTGRPGVVGFALCDEDGTPQPSVGVEPSLLRSLGGQLRARRRRKYRDAEDRLAGPVPWVTGACMLVDGTLLRSLTGMDEDFFLYYEEVALCRAVRARGRSVEFDPAIEVAHLKPLQNRRVSPKLRVITRHSKLLYFRKHRPAWEFAALRRLVAIEAAVRCAWARTLGRRVEARGWSAVASVARGFAAGRPIRGTAVRRLAESIAADSRDLRADLAERPKRTPATDRARRI